MGLCAGWRLTRGNPQASKKEPEPSTPLKVWAQQKVGGPERHALPCVSAQFPQTHFLQRRHIPRRRAHHPSSNLCGLTAHSSRVLPPKLRRPNFPTGRQAGKAKDSAQEGYSSCAKRLAASRSQAVSRRPTSKVRHFTLGFTGVNCKRIFFTLYTFDFPRRVCLLNKFGTAVLLYRRDRSLPKTMAKPCRTTNSLGPSTT